MQLYHAKKIAVKLAITKPTLPQDGNIIAVLIVFRSFELICIGLHLTIRRKGLIARPGFCYNQVI
jgi:hypothetical protein